jgi:hypothetical protein
MFCTKVNAEIKSALKQFDQYVDAHIDTALQITSALKSMLASPAADIITAIIPGSADDVLRTQLLNALTKITEALSIVDSCKQYTDLNDKLKCFVQQLSQRDPKLQDAILLKLSSLLAAELDGQKLKQSLYDLYTQAKYVTANN